MTSYPVTGAKPNRPQTSRRRTAVAVIVLGTVSLALYLLLYRFADQLTLLASQTREGHAVYALVPMAIALLFSLVHGSFTGHFWELMGLRARGVGQ